MAILDIFKHKKEAPKKKAATPDAVKTVAKKEPVMPRKEAIKQKRSVASVYNIISKPHISEKATNSSAINQYVFEVFNNANKPMVKEAIETIYNVDVLSVNIVNIPPKKRRTGRAEGFKKAYKKAIVKIGDGQKIEII